MLPEVITGPAAINPSPVAIVRALTSELHAQLEAAINIDSALGSINTYRQLLLGYLSIYRPFEQALSGLITPTGVITHPGLNNTSLLEQDLRALHTPAMHSLLPATLPPLQTTDEILGALYVVEGSSLGGQYIYRQVQQQLHLDSTHGAAFFYGKGPATGTAWKRFITLFDEHITSPHHAAASAIAMFHVFEQALKKDHRSRYAE